MRGRVTLSAKHQIIIPRDVRRQLGLTVGDGLLVEVRGNTILLVPQPKSYANRLRGLHKDVWRDVDAPAYLKEERKGWR